jgi:protein-disulfide isomerase
VVIYEDFLCPYCGELERATHTDLAGLADDGKVYVEYRPFDLLRTDYSMAAASAFKVVLDAAGPDVAKKFHDELYADQPDEGGPYPDADGLVEKAVAAGAAEGEVRDGIENVSQRAWVDRASAAAEKAGVRGTPTVLVDGKVYNDGSTVADLAKNLVASLR